MLHLIHPPFVHVSAAFLVVGGITEAWGLFTGRQAWTRLGGALVLIGTVSLVPTLATGYLAANSVDIGEPALEVLSAHELNGWFVLGLFGLALLWKGWNRGSLAEQHEKLYAVLLLLGVLLVIYSAFLGGQMVYTHGVGVEGQHP